MMKRYLLILALISLLAIVQIPAVFACSGPYSPPATLDDMIERDVLVRGIIMENSMGNSILYVERYLIGTGPRYLLVLEQYPSLYLNSAIRGYDYGCSGASVSVAGVGTHAYFSLERSERGYYRSPYYDTSRNVIDIIEGEDGRYVEYYQYIGDLDNPDYYNRDNYEAIRFTEAGFETLFADMLGHRGALPDTELDFPRFRTLNITTESGQRYMMPIDNYELVLLDEDASPCNENCPIKSPDGTHFAIPIPVADDTYAIWYHTFFLQEDWYEGWDTSSSGYFTPSRVTAQELLFSPNSDYFLAWNGAELTLYYINNWGAFSSHGRLPTISGWQIELAINATWTSEHLSGRGAWSKNSRAIAFWDADGLKWLDLTTMQEPRLLVENDFAIATFASTQSNIAQLPPVLELSTTGRYVRYGTQQEWSLFDTVNNHIFDDVLVNPDETALFALSPEDVAFEFNRPYHANVPDGYEIVDSFWMSDNTLIVMACELGFKDLCYPFKYHLEIGSVDYDSAREVTPAYTNAYAFDNVYGEFAWAFDEYTIRFKLSRYDDGIDFSEQLDSPIVSVEWGSPLWYGDR